MQALDQYCIRWGDIDKFSVLGMLGEGSYAKVNLVEKIHTKASLFGENKDAP